MLQGMEDSILGIWVAHGEGRLHVPDPATLDWIVENRLAPVRYVDPDGNPTTAYPYNPNGSPLGIAALCSPDGRHLAIMPHPERSFQLRQWPWVPPEWRCSEQSVDEDVPQRLRGFAVSGSARDRPCPCPRGHGAGVRRRTELARPSLRNEGDALQSVAMTQQGDGR